LFAFDRDRLVRFFTPDDKTPMDTDAFTGEFMRSLGQAISAGQTVSAWARNNDVYPEIAREWAERPAFLELVEKYRLEQAQSMVGKISNHVERAIERLVEHSEDIGKPNISLPASKAIIDKWIALTVHFVQSRQFQELTVQCEEIQARHKAQKKAGVGWAFRPGAG
jgi:hypothetical protein